MLRATYEEVLPLFQRALAISEKVLGLEHPDTATSLHNLAELYRAQGKYEEALPLYQRALMIYERVLGPEHPYVATCLENYADLLRKLERGEEAGAIEGRARGIRAKRQGK